MSDASVLSHEYKIASELAHSVNTSVMTLKRVNKHMPGWETISDDDVAAAAYRLSAIASRLASLLEVSTTVDTIGSPEIPAGVLARIREHQFGKLVYYVEDLLGISDRLSRSGGATSDEDLKILDGIAAATDAETSNVFARLMRR
jgi:hypothetical protein